ncbi:hypothetical protein PCL1606_36820 [Pseudomonas chlororaphis]|uniref:Uncharacterized protein n=1 Tax=Pseudomonas chlororaphis TaxID=587753 RepID=A0A0D5Y2F2_9PSED|nr:hypothetical protein PCL1606_36820 [Pseudomonas chlororaphis]
MWAAATTGIIHFVKKSTGHTPTPRRGLNGFLCKRSISINRALRWTMETVLLSTSLCVLNIPRDIPVATCRLLTPVAWRNFPRY